MGIEHYCDICGDRIDSGTGYTVEWQSDIHTHNSIYTGVGDKEERVVCDECWPGDGDGFLDSLRVLLE